MKKIPRPHKVFYAKKVYLFPWSISKPSKSSLFSWSPSVLFFSHGSHGRNRIGCPIPRHHTLESDTHERIIPKLLFDRRRNREQAFRSLFFSPDKLGSGCLIPRLNKQWILQIGHWILMSTIHKLWIRKKMPSKLRVSFFVGLNKRWKKKLGHMKKGFHDFYFLLL